MVSQAGEAAISGVALVDNINRLIIQVMAALATGGAVVCSQFVGKGKEEGAKKSGAQLETVLLVFSVCMTLLSLIGTRGLLHAVFGNVSEDVMDSAVLYFTVTSLSFPFLGIYNAGAAIFRSIGSIIKKILAIGIPSGVENGMFQIGKLAVTSMVATFGTASIAANSVGYTVIDFANIPGNAMGLALITVVGQCIGAGEKKQAKQYTKKLVGLAYLGDWICNIALFLLAGTIAKCFHLSPEAVRIAEQILHCFAVTSLFIWPLSFTLSNALRAAGDATFTMIVSIASMWIFRVGSSYFFGIVLQMGVLGIWIGMFVDWGARSALFGWRFLSGKWLQRKALA